jgi:hypothetical protein
LDGILVRVGVLDSVILVPAVKRLRLRLVARRPGQGSVKGMPVVIGIILI